MSREPYRPWARELCRRRMAVTRLAGGVWRGAFVRGRDSREPGTKPPACRCLRWFVGACRAHRRGRDQVSRARWSHCQAARRGEGVRGWPSWTVVHRVALNAAHPRYRLAVLVDVSD